MDNPFEKSDDPAETQGPVMSHGSLENQSPLNPSVSIPADEEKSNIITARGTAEGLVLRIDGRVEKSSLIEAVASFVSTRRSFLEGHSVAIEWVGSKPSEDAALEVSDLLNNKFNIVVRSSKLKTPGSSPISKSVESSSGSQASNTSSSTPLSVVAGRGSGKRTTEAEEKQASLFDGIGNTDQRASTYNQSGLGWDDPDARVFYTTLRSGQKIETEHSVIIFGDVNSGAEVISGGDIVILGTLRGICHAGAYDETGGGRVIFCLNLQATQLRIGTVISRGNASERGEQGRAPEVARVEDNMIVVEPYQSRAVWGRRRE